jgi:hypothetical protein
MGVAAIAVAVFAVAAIAVAARHANRADAKKRRVAREIEVAESIPEEEYSTGWVIAIRRPRAAAVDGYGTTLAGGELVACKARASVPSMQVIRSTVTRTTSVAGQASAARMSRERKPER